MDRDLYARRQQEKALFSLMLRIYCKKAHGTKDLLCPACAQLEKYAHARIDRCPRMKGKTFCSRCPSPCYKPDMRVRVKTVMRFSGPRMLLYHPLTALRHAFFTISDHAKRRNAK